ncbi:hypothetical protein QTP88_017455 [Uroleucon formosanum]
MDINKSITTKGGAAKEREKKRIKLNVAAKSCQNILHFFMPINKINEHDIDDPTSVSNLIMCPAKFKPNLKVVTSSDNQVIECSNNSLRSTLDSMRNDDSEYKQMFDRSVILCKKHDIAIPDSNSRKVSTRLDSNSSNQAFFNTKFDELKITVFYPLLDKLLSGIDLRFKQDTFDLVDAIACMLNMNLTQKTTKILSTFSKVSEDELITELKLLKNYENAMQLNGASSKSIYEWVDWLKTTGNSTVYTCVFKTLKMFTIIPVTSCTCERVFSKLTIVKNKLRSTMSQERLESLLLLFTEQEIVSKVDLNAVIDEFNSMGGEGKVVEIDESKFGKRKYHRGHRVEGQWVFGGVERETGRCFLVPVERRDKDTLLALVKDWILTGTTIISDCYLAKYMFLKSCRASGLDPLTEFFKFTRIVYDPSAQMQEVIVNEHSNSSNSDESEYEFN